jgi:hypothetical protein
MFQNEPEDIAQKRNVIVKYILKKYPERPRDMVIKQVMGVGDKYVDGYFQRIRREIDEDFEWESPIATSEKEVPMELDIAKVDAAWQKEPDFYIGKGGQGGIGNRYQRFQAWLQKKQPIEMPQIGWNDSFQSISFTNGRHRFAVLRDMGEKKVKALVPASQVVFFRKNFV